MISHVAYHQSDRSDNITLKGLVL